VGPAATMPDFKPVQIESFNSNTLTFNSNNFKLDSIQKGLSKLKKIEIKYDFEGFEDRNNFLHRNFFRLERDF
jgi:hypothetical protein